MNRPLKGHSVLIVEDEPLIAFGLTDEFARAGARVFIALRLEQALRLMGQEPVSAAVVDCALGNDDSNVLCELLRQRSIPFVHYSGYRAPRAAQAGDTVVAKPAKDGELVATVAGLLHAASRPSVH